MKLTKLNLLNFRNYDKLYISLNDNMNIFIGNNAQGKTNILESINLLALTKSYRAISESDLIKFNKEKAIVKGRVKDNNTLKELEICIEKGIKTLKINKTVIRRTADYISNLMIISFTPDDLEIIKSSPSVRRNMLNIQISQLSKVYLNTYNQYSKILKTRNEYLKILFTNSLADKSYLDVITDKLIEKAIIIYQMRREYIDQINENISKIYSEICTSDNKLSIIYQPNILLEDYDSENIRDTLKKIYHDNYRKELNSGMTLYGPHRDDFSYIIDDKDLKMYGSQGQQKVAVLSHKLSEINIFYNITKTKPVLLFDDIFSELDIKKRNRILKYVKEGIQTIITTTDIKNIQKKFLENAYIYEVNQGNVIRK
ncbi:MAG: DNA replication/repair protein RecF [Bacilli bacterium]|nr:DNA replication/repair protein RecF [Bacilli bacterium]